MSLLNEALRDLDQRQQQEKGSNPVPGALQDNGGGIPWLIAALSASLVLVSVLALWFWWQSPGEEQSPVAPEPVQSPAALSRAPAPAPDPSIAPIAEPVPEPRKAARAPAADAGAEDSAAPQGETDVQKAEARVAEPSQPQPEETSQQVAQTADPGSDEITNDSGSSVPETASRPQQDLAEPSDTQEAAASKDVRTDASTAETEQASVRQLSPQQVRARIARDIRERLALGDIKGATEQARRHLAQDSDAPATRLAMASHWLRQEQPAQALEWLPDGISGRYPQLRLLRARAELQQGNSRQALGWLTRDLPPVASHSRYHVTLAALQQQLGQHGDAAATWARLIEHDDSQARWWAGLGIALEGQGRQESARRAFVQASDLPGLNDTLQRYVQSRLSDGSPTSGNR